jgi:hypothetical protein
MMAPCRRCLKYLARIHSAIRLKTLNNHLYFSFDTSECYHARKKVGADTGPSQRYGR